MSKTTIEPEVIETQIAEPVKPYTFRRLSSEDMFLMFRIIGKIGIKELKNCFSGETLDGVMNTFRKSGGDEKALAAVGVAVGFDAIDILLNNLPKCEKEIYQLLAQVSGMGIDEIKKDMILFTEMLIDFVKKDEFPDFIKVVSKLFK
jgi:hypothetical protein